MTIETILERLKEVETENDIKILLAVEAGSRAWGFESPDSDWDVRFIYIHKPEWYFNVFGTEKDHLEKMYDDDIDLVGWDLRKALRLLYKSNPNLIEWLYSPIKYIKDDEFICDILDLCNICLDPSALLYHYRGIYTKQFKRYLSNSEYPIKRFMYYLRALLCCKYVEIFNNVPPVKFTNLVDAVVIYPTLKNKILELIETKKESKEGGLTQTDPELVEYARMLTEKYDSFDLHVFGCFVEQVEFNKFMCNWVEYAWE